MLWLSKDLLIKAGGKEGDLSVYTNLDEKPDIKKIVKF